MSLRALARVIVLLFLPLAHFPPPEPQAAATDTWSTYRQSNQRSGRTGAAVTVGTDGVLHLQWAYSLGERVEVEVEPIVAEGKAFLGAMNGVFSALDINSGTLRWQFSAGGPIAHSAAYADGRVFFGSLDGALYALRASDGQLLWKAATGGPVYAAPAVADGKVYIGSTSGRFFAFDAAGGAERWRFPPGAPLDTPFTGAAALSPDGGRIYLGNEDRVARAIDAGDGHLIWQRQLAGLGMRATHPLVSDDGAVVFFQTIKPGAQSYLPTEGYPQAAPGNDPVETWNQYYQAHPERRATYFLSAATGADLWNPAARRYVPLPLPYWGLLAPVLASDGSAWFPSPGGAEGSGFGAHELDHDSRLMRMDLTSGVATQIAVRGAFQHRPDENGRATFAGGDYLTTISEDLGTYRPATGFKATLAGSPGAGFGSHMDPLAPLPSPQLWRYGGTVAMGGVPGASPAVVAGGLVFYVSYGWLFAFGPANPGKDPTGAAPIAFAARDARASLLTYPQPVPLSYGQIQAEVSRRVSDWLDAGPRPPWARFDQPGGLMVNDVSGFQVFGQPEEQIRVLSQSLPYLAPALQARLRAALKVMAQAALFDPAQYQYRRDCLVYGQAGVQTGAICDDPQQIAAAWFADNELLIGDRLYAMAVYAEQTGDWASVDASWGLIREQFNKFTDAYDPARGFAVFPDWHAPRLGIASQIGAAAGALRMADHRGDLAVAAQARALLTNLLDTRVLMGHYAQSQYDAGTYVPRPMRIDSDGVPNIDDIFVYNDAGELIPLAGDRTRASDTRQVNWYAGDVAQIHSAAGFMYYPALAGYSPLTLELAARLRSDLLPETRTYVQTYEVNGPWWWLNDLAHATTAGGEHLWNSPTLAHDLFQTKAWVLNESWDALRRQLPLPLSSDPRYDIYRLDNLVTLLRRGGPGTDASLVWLPLIRTPG